MFSYRSAVAVKELGFPTVSIYNGGIKDWQKQGFPVERQQPLPEAEVVFIHTNELHAILQETEVNNCKTLKSAPLLTILDLRNGNFIQDEEGPPAQILTSCTVQKLLLDDLLASEMRALIPRDHPVITITETGNRDEFVIRYLSQHGFTNLRGLKFGMRGWLKKRYPVK